jgi:hypothetical protein
VEQGAATPVRLALLPDDGPTGGPPVEGDRYLLVRFTHR